MDLRLDNKRAVILGGAGGIGHAISIGFGKEGAQVAVVGRSADKVEQVAKAVTEESGSKARGFAGNAADTESLAAAMRAAADWMGGIDILVNTVSAPVFGPFAEHTDDNWQAALGGKLLPYIRSMREGIPYLERSPDRSGVIVNVIGTGGKVYLENHLAGGASNATLMILTTGLGSELGPMKVRVVGVSPGPVQTELFDKKNEIDAATLGAATDWASQVPTGRVASPEDIANAVVFLASPCARQINGTVVIIDGGVSACL